MRASPFKFTHFNCLSFTFFDDFRRQLRKAVVDHVSDSFLEPDTPLLMLISAAREGREKEVSFQQLPSKMLSLGN